MNKSGWEHTEKESKEQLDQSGYEEDFKKDVDIKLFKLIAYLEILRKDINHYAGNENETKRDLNTYYHKLGDIRYEIKKLLGHHLVSNTYIVNGDEL
tara:strand:- start:1628 stop:1918 length:291 start_codon:yes stop_codon:yes gene_type:complete